MSDELEVAALQLFEDLRSELPGLHVQIDPDDPNVEISVEIVQQGGLDFPVHLNFQNRDQLHLGAGDVFWCSWFPSSDPEVVARYREAVLGVISGGYRIVEYRRWGRGTGAHLQAPGPAGWRTVARSSRGLLGALPFRWGRAERVVQNRASASP
jgi:hypothetical protein